MAGSRFARDSPAEAETSRFRLSCKHRPPLLFQSSDLLQLQVDFRSWRLTLLVFFTIPFALVGGVLAAWMAGGVVSLRSLVGLAFAPSTTRVLRFGKLFRIRPLFWLV